MNTATTLNLQVLVAQMQPLAKDNYRIEKNKTAEASAYLQLQEYDLDKNELIDLAEFRNYYLASQGLTEIPVSLNTERCQAADILLNISETDSPEVIEAAFSYLVQKDTSIYNTFRAIASDTTQLDLRNFFAAMFIYRQGVDEDLWQEILMDNFFKLSNDHEHPGAAIYAMDFLYASGYVLSKNSEMISNTLLQSIQQPYIYNSSEHMKKALRTLAIFDQRKAAELTTIYIIEQLGKPCPQYEELANLLSAVCRNLGEKALPFITQLFRLTTDPRFHLSLSQALGELANIYAHTSALAALSYINAAERTAATTGSMIETLLSIGGSNPNLIIEKNIPHEFYMYTLLSAYDLDQDERISVLEYRPYYIAHTDQSTLISAELADYIQQLYSNTPAAHIIEKGYLDSLIFPETRSSRAIAYNELLIKNLLALVSDTTRPSLARLSAIKTLFYKLPISDSLWEGNLWGIVMDMTTTPRTDPVTCLEANYFMYLELGRTPDKATILPILETLRRTVLIQNSPDHKQKLEQLIALAPGW